MRAINIKSGMFVMHSGEWQEVADIAVSCPFVKVATMTGGHVAFMAGDKVQVRWPQ